MKSNNHTAHRQGGIEPVKVSQDLLSMLPIAEIKPAPENDEVYRPLDPSDPGIRALADSIRALGVKEPLVLSEDGYLLSGHRRLLASRLAGRKTAPCRLERVRRLLDDGSVNPDFLRLLCPRRSTVHC